MTSETNEFAALEMKLKEEVDTLRAQKLELVAEEDRLKNEKGKFETEWELIDEKREELRKEAERVAEEREAVSRLLKEERDSLRLEKKEIRDQHKRDVESLNHEREDFMNKMEQERSEWFNRIQKEHSDFLLGIEMQKRELESSIDKRREEIESHLRDKEKAFELEKKSELQHIASLREKAEKELEQATLEMKKLEAERMEINLDRERRDGEWAMLNKSIEELKGQTQKLEKQRQLLHGEREEIYVQIEQLKKLDNLKLALDDMEVEEMQLSNMESSRQKISTIRRLKQQTTVQDTDLASYGKLDAASNVSGLNSPTSKTSVAPSPNSARFSWIKRCTELVFKNSPEKPLSNSQGSGMSGHEDTSLTAGKLDSSNGYCRKKLKSVQSFDKSQPIGYVYGEPKVILEVPPKGDISKEACHVEYDVMEAANERLTFPISELAPQAEMKQVVDNSSLDDSVDSHNGKGQSNKRKRQEEDTFNDSVTSTQEAVYKDQHATEEADVVIIDKIIKVSEVACEITVPDTSAHQDKEVSEVLKE
ncbi:PROTEIN CROWDED NUCLEI 4 [Salix viminalis]|uniref:PROTEIN CROWDED NUCLEI 4 n=1 Tax=Salix viminalis TaxID=40686 RepID=A0A9Q0NN11_SALVM|nr:PROTEIN CROWDED NUCLEI 4 [Salix viminalis]